MKSKKIISFIMVFASCGNGVSAYNKVRQYIDENAYIVEHFCILDKSSMGIGLIASYEPEEETITLASNIKDADAYIEIIITEKSESFDSG